ncbi:MAG TPA: phage tail protein [Burkholderiaceae bacterium]|nr:phage tail protein [Burkholderiaceae bacterium]
MAETLGYALLDAGYLEAGGFLLETSAYVNAIAAFATSYYTSHEQQRRAQNAARQAAEESIKDRYLMTRSAIQPRQFVLGRQRVSGPLAYIGSYGTYREHLVFDVLLAAHEIDAIEAIYFDDEEVTLDGSGNVTAINRKDQFTIAAAGGTFTLTSAPATGSVVGFVDYGSTRVSVSVSMAGSVATVTGATAGQTGTLTLQYQPAQSPYVGASTADLQATITLDGSGNGSTTLPSVPDSGSLSVIYSTGSGVDLMQSDVTAYTSVAGAIVTVTGSPFVSTTVTVNYRVTTPVYRARVRKYLGAPGQTADAGMIANLPGIWTSAHKLTDQAHLVVELDYDADAFPSGLPNVSARVRGAKLYDPRTGLTAWSENPALMMRWIATHALFGRLTMSAEAETAIIVAANVCDQSTAYVVGGRTYTRALYTAGTVVKSGQRAKDILDDLARAMAGRWAMVGGALRVKAGAYVTPLQSLDDTWLTDKQSVKIQPRTPLVDLVNNISGKIVDEQRDYLELEYPRVRSSTYVAADGRELPQDMGLNAVTFAGQAQQVVATYMRDLRFGLKVVLTCNFKAWQVELFDTLYVTLSRFGWVNMPMEVMDVTWTLDGGIQLTLKQTDPSIYALATSFDWALPPAPTLFPQWNQVQAVAGLTCTAGTAQLLRQADGTIVSQIEVNWTAITDAAVLADGGVEIRYGLANAAESTWQSFTAERGQSKAYIKGVRDGLLYLVKARAFNALVKGAWTLPVLVAVSGKSAAPSNVAGLAATGIPGGVQVTWTKNTDADYLETEVRYGASWAAGTSIFRGAAAGFVWPWPAAGSYTIRVKHRDTSKNESAEATVAITVGNGSLIDTGNVVPGAISARATSHVSTSVGTAGTSGFSGAVINGPSITVVAGSGSGLDVSFSGQLNMTLSGSATDTHGFTSWVIELLDLTTSTYSGAICGAQQEAIGYASSSVSSNVSLACRGIATGLIAGRSYRLTLLVTLNLLDSIGNPVTRLSSANVTGDFFAQEVKV